MKARLALVAAVLLAAVPAARAGGDFVDVGARGARVWFVGAPGVFEFDARTGRTVARPRLVGAAIPLTVTLAGGAAWVGSVENGYVWGTLSRIDLRTHRVHVLWRRFRSSVLYVAGGAGGIYALIGSRPEKVLRFTPTGRLDRTWTVRGAGRMAADAAGCWISTDRRLVHIDPRGGVHPVLQAQLGDVATGAGAVWLPQLAGLIRVDERSGRVQTLRTGRLRLGGFQHDVAVGAGALWTLAELDRYHSRIERRDLRTGRVTGRIPVPGIADAVVVRPGALWVATVDATAGSIRFNLFRFDPRTLRLERLTRVL